MALTIGIVGLPNVGKSTLFNALTRAQVLAANYPFATIEPNVGVVPLPDARLDVLARLFDSERIVPATVSFVDIAGIVKGASEGEGLGNKFLANIREADAICVVTRAFADPDVVLADIETIHTELALADLQTLEKVVPRLEKEVRAKKADAAQLAAAVDAQAVLSEGRVLHGSGVDLEALAPFFLLTTKPFIYVFNTDDAGLADAALQSSLRAAVAPADAIFLDAKFEAELVELAPDEAREMLAETGQEESGLDQLARVGFHTLGLQTYLTAGPKESRAWTIHQGWTAPQAAGVIHTDFQKGFIKAEVIGYGGQGADRGQGLRDGRRRRGGVPLQRLGNGEPEEITTAARYSALSSSRSAAVYPSRAARPRGVNATEVSDAIPAPLFSVET